MAEKTYFSVQTMLAYLIARYILNNFYVYVAAEFDAVGNHPTSNPRLLSEMWLRVAAGNGLADDVAEWERVREVLRIVLLDCFARGELTLEKLEEGQILIATATVQSAAPLLYLIPHSDTGYDLKPGDIHEGYEDTEQEYLIPNLSPDFPFEIRLLR